MDTEPEDRALLTIMALSVLGLIDSLYLTYLHHLVAGGGGCPTQNLPGLDCGEVLASEQAELLGIPVAWFGVLGFIPGWTLAKILHSAGKLRIPRDVELAGLDYNIMEQARKDERAVASSNR